MYTLHCPVCGIATAAGDGAHDVPSEGMGHKGAECTQHHPDPEHHKDLLPPPGRTTVIVNVPPAESK